MPDRTETRLCCNRTGTALWPGGTYGAGCQGPCKPGSKYPGIQQSAECQAKVHRGAVLSRSDLLAGGGSTLYYGRKGLVIHAISAIDNALWDLMGHALGMPVYRLLGGETKPRIPAYCTGNDLEQHVEFGFTRLKLAMPYGPADGREGMKKNIALVRRARDLLGPDGEIMLDCWMAFTERYTLELAGQLEPYRVYWMEECLPPDDYAGMGRLNSQIDSTRMATGEHEYTRYGFGCCSSTRPLTSGSPT